MPVALITGASRGIGYAVAHELGSRGWNQFLVAQHTTGLVTAKEHLKGVLGSLSVDLGSGEEAAAAVATSLAAVSHVLDLLVLNAGIFLETPLGAVTEDGHHRNMAVNLDANMWLVKHLLPSLRASLKPRVVIIGSTAAYEPYPLVPTYGVAKWALRGYALNLRRELSTENIGVTLLSPGGTLTDMWAGEELPPDRLLRPSDIASMVGVVTDLSAQAVVEEIIIRPMLGDIHE